VLRVLDRPETIKQVTGIVANGFKDSLEVPMFTAYVIVTILAIAANAFSGIAAIVHWGRILPGMIKAGVPESWLTFPIGTLKTAGAVGLLLGLIGVPLIGTAAAIGLILFFVCALYTHVRAGDYSPQFGLANGFLTLAVASLVLGLAST
jgi:NAD/NADP transhydrogenase alpha subunit